MKRRQTDIAVIGASGQFPGANNMDEFWNNLTAGKSCISEIPPDRWSMDGFYDPNPEIRNRSHSKWGGFLSDIEYFDPLFFDITPREAKLMDPQQRLFLQQAWKAVEDAGYSGKALAEGKCGVFVGYTGSDYRIHLKQAQIPLGDYDYLGYMGSILAARIAHFLDLKGPCLAIDTACSSSLVAIHSACESIHSGMSDLAIAGGVDVRLTMPDSHILMSNAGILSPEGKCKAFDNAADGIVPGEGVGAVVLKSLQSALKNGDHIYAIIKGSAVNHDGRTKGITVPSGASQTALECEVYDKYNIHPKTITYVEAHGTGTKKGDPIEAKALMDAFGKYTQNKQYCALGSVKTNIGHSIGAAGIAGLIKILLCLKHKKLVPSLNFHKENELICFGDSPFYVNTEFKDWESHNGQPRRAATSAFGLSGTNCHMVIEEAPSRGTEEGSSVAPYHLIPLSAKTETALSHKIEDLARWLEGQVTSPSIADISYTLLVGRSPFPVRCALVVRDVEELRLRIKAFRDKGTDTDILRNNLEERPCQQEHVVQDFGNRTIKELQEGGASDDEAYKEKLQILAKLYTDGYELDWLGLYLGREGRRIPLPTYPFARARYWIPKSEVRPGSDEGGWDKVTKLHPMVHHNTSTLREQRFTTELLGTEFYLADHVVGEKKVLPAVAYIEMARAAGEIAGEARVSKLRDVVWASPIVVGERRLEIQIGLYPDREGVDYEVGIPGEGERRIVTSRGRVMYEGSGDRREAGRIDLEGIKARCSRVTPGAACYEVFQTVGTKYGPGFRVVQEILSSDAEALSYLHIPEGCRDGFKDFMLHPALMDGALQTVMGLMGGGEASVTAHVPFSLREVEIFGSLPETCCAYVTSVEKGEGSASQSRNFDVQIVDEKGQALVKMKGLTLRALQPSWGTSETEAGLLPSMVVAEEQDNLGKSLKVDDSIGGGEPLGEPLELSQQQKTVLREKTELYLKEVLSQVTGVPIEMLRPQEPFENYGIDSYTITQLTMVLEKDLGELSQTLFFEYQSIGELATYFLENHREKLMEITDSGLESGTRQALLNRREDQSPSTLDRPRFLSAGISPSRVERVEEDIAIIGFSGRYPMARDLAEFWENLQGGKDCILEIPAERWDHREYYDPEKGKIGKSYSKWGGFIEDVDKFDALFFNISPREAESLDPQERLFLETVWHAVEDAGYTRRGLAGERVGVFVGVMYEDYHLLGAGASHASIANRVSYTFDFHGPSIALDTMCSSSLTAIHLACESIRRGEIEVAIAGGVNVSVHPQKYIGLSMGGFVSSDGRCRSFGEGGDGYVPGEGVGAALLKPLDRAIEDGDHIYGVIKGTTVNHGGKTNGYSVPNPKAQANAISEALKRAKVDARTISYLEAHGTGTSLGDPIEMTGLTKAFRENTQDRQYCSIGSVKSNIGHLESAAGIASLAKVLLQMKHRQLVPSLHSEELNPNINFQDSPFYVQHELTEWKQPVIEEKGEERKYPRRAGISSFGAGGANAHVVVEEYENPIPKPAGEGSQIIVLSAKDEERLKVYAKEMADSLARYCSAGDEAGDSISLADIAYTLQIGREAMEERLAVVVSEVEELVGKLKQYCQGKGDIESLYTGKVSRAKAGLLLEGRAGEQFVRTTIEDGELSKVAQLWVSGVEIDWGLLYPAQTPHRVSLPTYPFARESHWMPQREKITAASDNGRGQVGWLHPLVHRNSSTLREQCFITELRGDEFYLADHVVAGQKVLPGVVHIEMAHAAGEMAGEAKVNRIRNIVWARPILSSESLQHVKLSLYPTQDAVDYEVSTTGEDNRKVVHSQGKLLYEGERGIQEEAEIGVIDIEGIKERCQDAKSGEECYRNLQSAGLSYGPRFQAIQELFSNGKEALSRLELPSGCIEGFDDFVQHPSLMDGALQTVIGLVGDEEAESDIPYVPFSLGEVEIVRPLPEHCYAYATVAGEQEGTNSGVRRFNIELVDEGGVVLVRLKDFMMKALRPTEVGRGAVAAMYFRGVWEKSETEATVREKEPLGSVLILDVNEEMRDGLREKEGRDRTEFVLVRPGVCFKDAGNQAYEVNPVDPEDYRQLVRVLKEQGLMPNGILHRWSRQSGDEDLGSQLQRGIYSVFHLTQALMEQKPKEKVQLLYMYESTGDEPQPQDAAISAFAKTIRQENPKFSYKTIEMQAPSEQTPALVPSEVVDLALREFQTDSAEVEIRYNGKQRSVRRLKETPLEAEDGGDQLFSETASLKEGGVYLITGGAGGLGLIFAEHLAGKMQARLVLTGRSDLSPQKEAKLLELQSLDSEVAYIKADVSKREEVEALILETKSRFGEINGILHCAGVKRDAFVLKKTQQEMKEVLAPKVYGTVFLDEATKEEDLDFFVLFSSITAVTGNVGQSDYAYANRFMDNFAELREKKRAQGNRKGKSFSINWPWWQDGGMGFEDSTALWSMDRLGMFALTTSTGIQVFEDVLKLASTEMMVIEGEPQKVRSVLGLLETGVTTASNKPSEGVTTELSDKDEAQLRLRTEAYLKELLSEQTKLPAQRIHSQELLETYGIDSVMIMSMTRRLEECFGELSKTLFFEYQSIEELATYFLENHREKLMEITDSGLESGTRQALLNRREDQSPSTLDRPRFLSAGISPSRVERVEEDIAIIGFSGRYPMARDLAEFWENLQGGKDCILEIPAERWDHREYYDPEKGKIGKSYSKWGGFIEDVDKFDALFFNISPREAESLDPQERLFLETVWHAVEDAGYTRRGLAGERVGVFVGVMYEDYHLLGAGASHASIANRVSYTFDFHGPSIALDTMCSSSLTAIHLACESIRRGEIEVAIAGGVNVSVHPQKYIGLSMGGFVSSDGRCRSFGEGGDGYVPGEGVGAALLKPLDRAIEDGDHIYGVIKGTTVNHGGKTNGYSVPNPKAQANAISEALKRAKVDARTISYLEAHGTGTSLGDPIEMTGLTKAFRENTQDRQYCSIGSVKSNIGHLESAAGIASLAKVLLQMKHRQLVPSLHSEELNPNINFQDSPFYVQHELTEWKQPVIEEKGEERKYPRRAGISSFGAGGANAHVVVEEYENPIPKPAGEGSQIIVLSAKDEERLKVYAKEMADSLARYCSAGDEAGDSISLADIAYTLQIGREAMEERLAVVVSEVEELVGKLKQYCQGKGDIESLYTGKVSRAKAGLLLEGRAGEQFVRTTIEDGELSKVAQLWVSGVEIDWGLLYPAQTPHRVSLPTYPFARESHWMPKPEKKVPVQSNEQDSGASHASIDTNGSIIKELKQTISEVLKIDSALLDDLNEDTSIADLDRFGLNSLLLLEVMQAINRKLGLGLRISDLQDANSLRDLVNHVDSESGAMEDNPKVRERTDEHPSPKPSVEEENLTGISADRAMAEREYLEKYDYAFPGPNKVDLFFVRASQGLDVEMLTCGEGPAIVLLPPIASIATAWMYQASELSKHFQVIVPNYPGYGRSEFSDQAGSISAIANGMLEVLHLANVRHPFHLVGWSMGGMIAQIMAERCPERIKTLTLVSTTSHLGNDDSVENALRIVRLLENDFELNVAETMGHGKELLFQCIKATQENEISRHYFSQVLGFDFRNKVSGIHIPTLVAAGDKDEITPLTHAKDLHSEIENSEYHEIKGGGHYMPLQYPETLNQLLLDFIRRHENVERGTDSREALLDLS